MGSTDSSTTATPLPSSGALACGQPVGAGRFRLKKILGQGGMGVVWLAHDLHLGEPVALKFLPPQIACETAALSDLRRETLRSRKLSHPNIVRIHDFFQLGQEPPFIAMEFVDGPNLHFLRENRPLKVLTWKFLLPLARQLCAALLYAHEEKVIHRDIKPANLMLDSSGRLKLADFGLARVAHDSMTRMSGLTMPGGTIDFMSPQQADGNPAQVADDIYSLGATLYDLLTSRPPFYQGDIAYQVRHTKPDPMLQRLADLELTNEIPEEVAALVMACLAKDPNQRPANMQAILDVLDAGGLEGSAKFRLAPLPVIPPPPAQDAAMEKTVGIGGSSVDGMRPQKMNPSGLVVLGVVLLIVGAVFGIKEYRSKNDVPPITQMQSTKQSASFNLAKESGTDAADGIAAPPKLPKPTRRNQIMQSSTPANPMPSLAASSLPDEQGFVSLFNGRDLTGWEGDRRWWSVVDGSIQGMFTNLASGRLSVLVCLDAPVDDFELRLSFRTYGGACELLYRAQKSPKYDAIGYVCLLTGNGRANRYLANGTSGGLTIPSRTIQQANEIEYNQAHAFRKEAWNDMTILVRSNWFRHEMNGRLVEEVRDMRSRRLSSGLVALAMPCSISDRPQAVQIKNIRLKRLTPAVIPRSQSPLPPST